MLRFTTAVVTKAACRSLASSAMLHCLQAATVAFEEREKECKPNYFHRSAFALHGEGGSGGVEVERNASNTSSVGSVSEHNNAAPLVDFDGFRGATKPTVSDVPQVPAKSEQSKDCLARLEALLVKLDSGDAAVAELREATRLARNEIDLRQSQIRGLQRRCQELEEEEVQLTSLCYKEFSLDIVAEALRIVDEEFKRGFDTPFSLREIWFIPEKLCPDEPLTAMNNFLKENETILPQPVRMQFFSAWQSIHYRFKDLQRLGLDVRDMSPDRLKHALATVCGEWSKDVQKSLLDVILSAVAKSRREGRMP